MTKRLVHPVTGSYLIRIKVAGRWRWQAFMADGKFADKATKDMLTKYWFGRKRMWRLTMGHSWVVHDDYVTTKLQAWGYSKTKLRAKMLGERWEYWVRRHSAQTIIEEHRGCDKYVKLDKIYGGRWKPNVEEWFDWTVNVGWDHVPLDRKLVGKVDGPKSERL